MPYAQNGDVRLHWEASGPQQPGPGALPILLVMGHLYSSAMWYPILPALAARRRVVRFDNRGTGESGFTRHAKLQDLAADAFAVMDAAGLAKAHIFGVSMGGVIVLEMARRRPDRVVSLIVGCSGMLTADKPRTPAWVRALYYLPRWLLRPLIGGRGGYGSAADPAAVATDLEVLAKERFVVAGVVAQAEAIAGYGITRDEVAAMTLPALVLHGDEDKAVPFAYGQELAQTLPDSRFVPLAGSGHNFLVARKDEAIAAVTSFLDEVERGA
jgi:pimeloyl-ACP methyl ester carboxylesterase